MTTNTGALTPTDDAQMVEANDPRNQSKVVPAIARAILEFAEDHGVSSERLLRGLA